MKITLVFLLLTTILQRAFSVDNYDNEHIHAWLDNYHGESEVSFSEEEKKNITKKPSAFVLKDNEPVRKYL